MKKITKLQAFTLLLFLTVTATFSQVTINVSAVNSGTGEEDVAGVTPGDISLSSSDLEFYFDAGTQQEQISAVRFTGVVVPNGATIINAYIQFKADQSDSGSVIVNIVGDDVDNSQALDTNDDFNFSNRTPTSTNVSWNISSWTVGSTGVNERTDDIKDIITEITSRVGWNYGNAMTFIFTGVSSANNTTIREAESGSSDTAPVLHIEYAGSLPEENYIVAGDVWKYYDNSQAPPNDTEGDTWKENAFNDGGWSSGSTPLGYGDMNVTPLNSINNSTEVAYFRKTFTVTDHTVYNSLDLEAVRDDGMVVYVNGVEVWSNNMDAGTVNYSTFANTVVSGSSEGVWLTQSAQNELVTGLNVVAVEVHQENAGSSDISFNFKLTGSTAIFSPVTRGPYLQSGTSTSVIVKWTTSIATDTKVNYGTSLGDLSSTVSDGTLTTDHEITISSLSPNTTYYYELEDASGVYQPEDANMYVKTAPTIGAKQFVRAWVLGDAGTSGNDTFGNDQEDVRDAYYNYVANTTRNPNQTDMMLFLGDNAYNSGTQVEYQKGLFDIYDELLKKSVAWSTLGNHDGYSVTFDSQSGPYYDIFTFPTAGEAGGTASGTEEYYSFDYANIHFIVLQSYNVDGGGTEAIFNTNQKNWLTTDINATTQDWIVSIFHHPPYTKGSHDSDNDGETGLKTMREQYLPILEAGGVDLTLSGHSHSYERSRFIKSHTGYSNTFNSSQTTSGGHIVGANGNLSGRSDISDGAYEKTALPDGAVYITAGSSGKATGASFSGDPYNASGALPAMYYSAESLGSTIIEVEDDGIGGQNMNVKFLRDTGVIDDYFTIHKASTVLSIETTEKNTNSIQVYPIPSNDLLHIKLSNNEQLEKVRFYNTVGALVKEISKEQINVSSLKPGVYMLEITTNNNKYYKSIILE